LHIKGEKHGRIFAQSIIFLRQPVNYVRILEGQRSL